MQDDKNIFEIIFHARGGQGAKTAAEIIAQAAVFEGKFVQAFPQFGPERSGAPTKTFVRISDNIIRTHEPVINPDVVVILDETILDAENILQDLRRQKFIIINTTKSEQEIAEKISSSDMKFSGKIHTIDANGISMQIVGQPRPNTVILGKFVQATETVKIESVITEFKNIFESKLGKEATDKNILAIEKAYNTI